MAENQNKVKRIATHWRWQCLKIIDLLRFLQKQSDESFTNRTSTVQLKLLNVWLLKTRLKDEKNGVITKTWTSDYCKYLTRSDESSFTLFPTSVRVFVWRTPKEAYNPECLLPTVKHGGGSVTIWAAISWYSPGPLSALNGRITARDYLNTSVETHLS